MKAHWYLRSTSSMATASATTLIASRSPSRRCVHDRRSSRLEATAHTYQGEENTTEGRREGSSLRSRDVSEPPLPMA